MLALPLALLASKIACRSDLDCSLNGLCTDGACVCDVPWGGARCQTLLLAAGREGVGGIPLAAYHGDSLNATSWGASVLHAPEDGRYYMWVAAMTNKCPLADWMTNSEVHLAVSDEPLGPFAKIRTLVSPWAHNPQTIRAPDATVASGHAYVLFTLGDGKNYHGDPKVCDGRSPAPPMPPVPPPPWVVKPCRFGPPHGQHSWAGCMVANFTLFWSETPAGKWREHTAQILDWPVHHTGRPWDYGPYGNWNPAPIVHPNGTIFVQVRASSSFRLRYTS
uniref:EGF-like domain-containing protein n=1 Tax=Haptolina brevifila TaxID=156173 RepID=A0A7S2IT13_9EUKA|mmetsp:Transcript_71120/g.141003  ORF Transcript_71120/g.141003 Transcript_71120/m.141003 type:complete len:277 (+) Transcript_71120:74-904(+)